MRRYTAWTCGLLACSLMVVLTTGCEPSAAPAPTEELQMTEKATPTASAATPGVERIPAAQPPTEDRPPFLPSASPTEMAVDDLAKRLGVAAEDVVVMDIRETAMPAADLGCPGVPKAKGAVGMVLGQEIVLAVGGQEYVYRAHGERVVPCPPAGVSTSVLQPCCGPSEVPLTPARQDLSRRLGIGIEEIEVQSVEAVEWPDTSLGCPQPGMMYAQVITPGYRILLRAGGQTYEYHSDRQRAILCQP
ncbi:MAG: hypothetical protein QHJ81_04145 [Anaerolineae bacterium]|nr:hypothetical protein [Anaerolineae bacterium]